MRRRKIFEASLNRNLELPQRQKALRLKKRTNRSRQ
jgi:hypothetical protein